MTKQRQRRGSEITESYESRLMDALAAQLMDRESDHFLGLSLSTFDRTFMDHYVFPKYVPAPQRHYYRAWFIADLFAPQLEYAIECVRRNSADDHKTTRCPICIMSLTSCARLADISEHIQVPDTYDTDGPRSYPARIALAEIQAALPFDSGDRRLLERCITTAVDSDHFAALLGDGPFLKWDSWLRRCQCTFSEMYVWPRLYDFDSRKIDSGCPVHQVLVASVTYAKLVQTEWQRVQNALEAAKFEQFYLRSEGELLGDIGLRVPSRLL
jgi:hypothetical protein